MPAINNEGFIHDEVNEVLGRTPVWLVRWGNTLILCIALGLLGVSCIVYYPDTIKGKATIVPTASKMLNTPDHETTVEAVFIKHGSDVKKNETLCILRSVDEPAFLDTIVAPATGVVHFQRTLQASSALPANAGLMIIEGSENHHRIVIETSSFKAGKIRLGQKVQISPLKYPQQEFGELEATIVSLPSAEQKGIVTLDAELTKGTTTNQGHKLQLGLTSSGLATIVTDKRTVFERLFWFL